MEMVLRAAVMYAVLMIIFRISGKRTLSQITTFDLILLIMIGDSTQQAMLGNDYSITNSVVVIITLVSLDIAMSVVKQRSQAVEKAIDSVPLIIVENGRSIQDRMQKSRVDEGDVMEVARETAGVERLDQIKYAVLERSGKISVIPKES